MLVSENAADKELTSVLSECLRSVAPNAKLSGLSTILVGENAVVDSVGFLGFLMSAEAMLGNTIDLSATLIEYSNTDPEESPFHTIGSLTSHIEKVRGR